MPVARPRGESPGAEAESWNSGVPGTPCMRGRRRLVNGPQRLDRVARRPIELSNDKNVGGAGIDQSLDAPEAGACVTAGLVGRASRLDDYLNDGPARRHAARADSYLLRLGAGLVSSIDRDPDVANGQG